MAASSVTRVFSRHNKQVQQFLVDTVDLVLERIDEQRGQGVTCCYNNDRVEIGLRQLLEPLQGKHDLDAIGIARRFASYRLAEIIEACVIDLNRYPIQDPALSNLEEVFYASNGFWATVAYRIAHELKQMGVPVIPRAISGLAHSRTGIDIHPGAKIAPGLFIDHGTGIAIGCTAVLGRDVSLYNGVVLGTRSRPTKVADQTSGEVQKRHPTIGNDVSLFTGAFVGGDIVVGDGATIGAFAFVTEDVPAGRLVSGKKDNRSESRNETSQDDTGIPKVLTTSATKTVSSRPAILSLIGYTPVVPITSLHRNPNVKILAKLEGSNPSGSVKDRVALSLIELGEADGSLTHDKIILESTSGNTGIGLAMVGAAKGYKVVLTMSAAMSEERKKVLRAFGAELIETDGTKGTGGAIEVARRMVREQPDKYWMANQHASLNNPAAHYGATADEILEQVPDVTHFVAGIGTFGTLRGAGVRLREELGAKVIGVEPKLGQSIQGLRNMKEPNPPELYDESLLDEKFVEMADAAHHYTRLLAKQEGLLVGMSSGAAMHAAADLAERIESGTIVVLFPDRGEKYLSTPMFDVPAMNPTYQLSPSITMQSELVETPVRSTDAFAYSI